MEELSVEQIKEHWKIFKKLGIEALKMSHYDLVANSKIKDIDAWRSFLLLPEVSQYVDREAMLLRRAEMSKLTADVSESTSVGKAQLITALGKIDLDVSQEKEGPAFIYTYIPLTPQQLKAPNVKILDHDIFAKPILPTVEEPKVELSVDINEEDKPIY